MQSTADWYGFLLTLYSTCLKFCVLFTGVCITASVFTIMAVSLDRYVAIRHPVKLLGVSRVPKTIGSLLCIWGLASLVMLPIPLIQKLQIQPIPNGETLAFCLEMWPSQVFRKVFDVFLFVILYVVPGSVVTYCYASTGCKLMRGDRTLRHSDSQASNSSNVIAGRRRLARMLLILAILFACSWLPYYVTVLYESFSNGMENEGTASGYLTFRPYALLLGHSHTAQNPILYFVMNPSFKQGVKAVMGCRKMQRGASSRYHRTGSVVMLNMDTEGRGRV